MADELIEMVGQETYDELHAFIDERATRLELGVALPHPTLRRAR